MGVLEPLLPERVAARLRAITLISFVWDVVRFLGITLITGSAAVGVRATDGSLPPVLVTVVALVVVAALYAWVFVGLHRRRRWARVVGTVFAGVSLIASAIQVADLVTGDPLYGATAIVTLLIDIAFLLTAWLPPRPPRPSA
ncbi:hypothetical protein GCM10010988_37490 [Cnuibacter physcomitrellae]|uniref:Uncharacterized protein n=1 Tax=Cnuibacter physcomitrellae TaxID=1619308 RepID=A0A1X9LHS7_9MICO|nr:hypothetical protein [Cnuibacter physcomitrellae]ARJ04687.1 hypothetical protein B5808_05190 [Cnuibacter physcomitrellae]GGI42129.1 hypothetical protein GCM10010988_37490 [Cnuibacter physcomitrellae]